MVLGSLGSSPFWNRSRATIGKILERFVQTLIHRRTTRLPPFFNWGFAEEVRESALHVRTRQTPKRIVVDQRVRSNVAGRACTVGQTEGHDA